MKIQSRGWALRQTIKAVVPTRLLSQARKIDDAARQTWGSLQWLYDTLWLELRFRGQKPRIHFPIGMTRCHNIWQSYATHPPVQYSPYRRAELCHWINRISEYSTKPCIVECEHILAMAGNITDWQWGLQRQDLINRQIQQKQCRFVFTYSAGLLEHSKRYLHRDVWHKVGYIYPVSPPQPEYPKTMGGPFTILVIASRFSDKGLPEAIEAYRILRDRHGSDVQMLLVSQAVPSSYRLPEGIVHYNIPRMNDELKSSVFRSAHVLFIPCYSDSAVPILEACAFGVATLTTRIHHGDEFVREGVTGHLIIPPIYSYSEHYGTRWKTWEGFLADLDTMRERGEFKPVVEQSVDRLEAMLSSHADLEAMGRAARALYADRFSPAVRNRKLLRLYDAALKGETGFPV